MSSTGLPPPAITKLAQYPPTGESAADLWFERANLDGTVLAGIAYGVHATLFFTAFAALWPQRKARPMHTYIFLAYICAHFTLGTLGIAAGTQFNEMVFINNREYPGGPNAFFIEQANYWSNYMTYVVYIITAWLQDWLLVYRFFILFDSRWYVIIVPGCLYLVSMVMSSLLLAQIRTPGNNVWQSVNVNFFITFWAIEIATTILLTSFIVGRLLFMRYRLRKIMGPKQQSPYLSITAMLVESALLFSVCGVAFLISYAYNDPFQNIVLNVTGQVQSIAPVLIVMRVAQGAGLTKQTLRQTNTMTANNNSNSNNSGATKLRTLRFNHDTGMSTTLDYDSKAEIDTVGSHKV